MYKLSHQVGDNWTEFNHEAVFTIEDQDSNNPRVRTGAPYGRTEIFQNLAESLKEPCFLLYVLHTPRGEGNAGRYQSPSIERSNLRSFLTQFEFYLSADSRFDIWVYSPEENATVVWDRHNIIYAYGSADRFSKILKKLGFAKGCPNINFPHQHHYRAELDGAASKLLNFFNWSFSPLRPEDEQ